MSSGTTNDLYGIWGSSSSDVFAVGENGTILHYNGIYWSPMSSNTTNRLQSIWGSSSDVFAVGLWGTVLHYNGSVWDPMGGVTNDLYGVWGTFPSSVFSVGLWDAIFYYNGSTWDSMSSGTTRSFYDVWGTSSSDVFIVGMQGSAHHYNGISWSQMSSSTTNRLQGIWGFSASDVFAVGMLGTIVYYDGSTWSSMNSGTIDALYGIWGSSSSDVFAVGENGTILHMTTEETGDTDINWVFPDTSDLFLAPTPNNNRPYIASSVGLPTGTEPSQLLGVYHLDETTGEWEYFIPAFTMNTLDSLDPNEAYYMAVSGACSWKLPSDEVSSLPTGEVWVFPGTSDLLLAPTSTNSRPYLASSIDLPTGTEPSQLLGVYHLVETTGEWEYFIPAFTMNTLDSLDPGEAYYMAVSGACSWQLRQE
ncbi:WD40/YVTN/BNR-like repeat-containing protein, partial [Chloroflexota bacterium]